MQALPPGQIRPRTSPHCGSRDERGDQCETCGKQLEPHELKESYCITCHSPPIMKLTEHWFFRLSGFSSMLYEWIDKNRHWPDNARNFSLGWIKDGLEDRAITRDLSWGVPVPLEEAKGKGPLRNGLTPPIGYISATREWAQKIGKPENGRSSWQQGTQR